MNIFDIVGPVMVGPSSSHTAGVVRIGNVVREILGYTPSRVRVKFHGSFAKTYAGHGSDKAVVAGLLGFKPDDERIRESFKAAREAGMDFSFETISLADAHPNTVIIEAEDKDGGRAVVVGESVGGGGIMIRRINDIEVEFDGEYDTLIISHKDSPGAIALVTNVLSVERINIAKMKVYRARRGGDAIMIIEADGRLNGNITRAISNLPNIRQATVLSGIA